MRAALAHKREVYLHARATARTRTRLSQHCWLRRGPGGSQVYYGVGRAGARACNKPTLLAEAGARRVSNEKVRRLGGYQLACPVDEHDLKLNARGTRLVRDAARPARSGRGCCCPHLRPRHRLPSRF